MNSEEIAYIHSPVKASRHSIYTHTHTHPYSTSVSQLFSQCSTGSCGLGPASILDLKREEKMGCVCMSVHTHVCLCVHVEGQKTQQRLNYMHCV